MQSIQGRQQRMARHEPAPLYVVTIRAVVNQFTSGLPISRILPQRRED
jgi:hypothetical protein